MDLDTTWWLLGVGLALFAGALTGDLARRRTPLAWHAHLPWNALIFVGLAIMLFAAVHIFGLFRLG